jgi:lysophospholipase L1-like esterase
MIARTFAVVGLLGLCMTGATGQVQKMTAPAAPAQPAPAASVSGASSSSAPAPDLAKEATAMQQRLADWPKMGRYKGENAALKPPEPGERRVVFFGDSITDNWGRYPGTGMFFPGRPYVNRGIGGQTTTQMVVRFRQDVVDLHPAVVVILAGTNDIAGNTGPMTPEMTEDNLRTMVDLAKANGIRVVLTSITPAAAYPWRPGVQPIEAIKEINAWMRAYCADHGVTYVDYYSAMSDESGAMKTGISFDGVHPNANGYEIMAPLAQQGIDKALANTSLSTSVR